MDVKRTWNDAAARWLREKSHKADYKHDVEKLRWIEKHLGNYRLEEISRDVIENIIDAKSREVSASTVNRYLALIRAILRMARDDWEWVTRVPRAGTRSS